LPSSARSSRRVISGMRRLGRSKPCFDSRSAPHPQQCGNASPRLRRSQDKSVPNTKALSGSVVAWKCNGPRQKGQFSRWKPRSRDGGEGEPAACFQMKRFASEGVFRRRGFQAKGIFRKRGCPTSRRRCEKWELHSRTYPAPARSGVAARHELLKRIAIRGRRDYEVLIELCKHCACVAVFPQDRAVVTNTCSYRKLGFSYGFL